ncbi:CHAT domain-containing protein [Suillus occidentalis]|nr:CHAT domain-containing protein [Suillus occidentalis]
MSSSLEGQFIWLEVISGENIQTPSARVPAGIYISISVDSRRRWKSANKVLSSDKSVAWGDTAILSLDASPKLSLDIIATFELDQMSGNGDLIGDLGTTWGALLNHGDEVDLSFSPIFGVRPSLTLKAAIVHSCDNQESALLDSTVDCEISHDTDVGHARFAEYVTNKTVSHLNDSVEHFQSVLDQCPVDHPGHAAALSNLAWASLQGFMKNDSQDIDLVTSLIREALALRPQGHPDYPLSLYHLTEALTWRYIRERTAVHIHESAQLYCKLLSLCPEGTNLRSIAAGANSVDYVINACNRLPTDASDEGIHLRRIVLQLCPPGHPHPRALGNLANALDSRFEQCGRIDVIDESIQVGREAVSLCPEGYDYCDDYLNILAVSLRSRFDHQGRSQDLDETISLVRYDKLDVSEDLNEAIDLYRESLRLTRIDHPERHRTLYNLGMVLCLRFTKTQKNEDIEEAIRLCQESLEVLPSLHPSRFSSYTWLHEAYLSRYRVRHKSADFSLAIENFRLASRHPTREFPERIRGLLNGLATQKPVNMNLPWKHTNCAWSFDNHVMTRSSVISRREAATAVRGAQSLPVDVASCAIRRNNLRQAVELIEQGRGQQWSLVSRLRTPIEDLESINPELAHKFSKFSKCLSEAHGSAVGTDRAAVDRAETQYRKRTEQWGAVVAEIRHLEGFSRFLLQPSYEDLQAAACQGPVIILIASQYLRSAIIVPMSGEPYDVRFPRLTLADLKKLKGDFAKAIKQAAGMRPKEPRKDLRALLRIVWDEIMLPIVNALEHNLKLQHRSRIWLCPTADFTSIPLHPANPIRMKADGSGPEHCLEDLYIGSYTPTLSALIRAQQAMRTRVDPSFVAIGQEQPGARRGKALLAVGDELELVCKLFPATAKLTTLSGDEATQAVHLACHGKQDHKQPYNSHFAMRDKPLTLLDIMEQDIPHAEFAFLSACHTAVGNEKSPDEVIHLAAGLQFSGFKSVIGTLWGVDDAVAKHVVKSFYEKMFEDLEDGGVMDCTKAARALNHATYFVKKVVPLEQRMFSSFKSVIGTLWVVDNTLAKHIIVAFYKKIILMFEDLEDGGVISCSTATRELNQATHAVKMNVSVHIDLWVVDLGFYLSSCLRFCCTPSDDYFNQPRPHRTSGFTVSLNVYVVIEVAVAIEHE